MTMWSTKGKDRYPVRYTDEPPINSYLQTFFEKYASISKTELGDHLLKIRENSWNIVNFPCIGLWYFIDLSILKNPIYNEVVDRCKNDGATLIDFACCFGHDIRLWIYDGVPIQQLRGYDIDSRFIEQGYQLFRDEKLMKDNHVFQSADIFDDQFLEKVQPADYVHAGFFIHLFDEKTQHDVCRRLTRLSKNAIFGRQIGAVIPEERYLPVGMTDAKMMCHSPSSFANMWNEATNGQWKVEHTNIEEIEQYGNLFQMLIFVVRKIN